MYGIQQEKHWKKKHETKTFGNKALWNNHTSGI